MVDPLPDSFSTPHSQPFNADSKGVQGDEAEPGGSAIDAANGFYTDYIRSLEALFIERLHGRVDSFVVRRLKEVILPLRGEAMADAVNPDLTSQEKHIRADARRERYEELYDSLDAMPDVRQGLIEMQAKLQDISAIARKHATAGILKAEQGAFGASADDITYTLRHFRSQGVRAEVVQRYLDEVAATFSLTSHPTNATSVAHTTSAIRLEQVLAHPDASAADIHRAMDRFIDTPVAAPRKTPAEELEELIPVLDNLFDGAALQRQAILTALQVSGYGDDGVVIRTPMLALEDWSATFDGDGNVNATREAMEAGVDRKRRWIRERYTGRLDAIEATLHHEGQYGYMKSRIAHIKHQLSTQSYPDVSAMQADLETLQSDLSATDGLRHEGIDELLYLSDVFGFVGSVGNIRHDAQSIHQTLRVLVKLANLRLEQSIEQYNKEELSTLLTGWFSDPEGYALQRLRVALTTKEEKLQDVTALDDTPRRILERLHYLASEPEIANKLIIAEAAHPADVKAAMVLLSVTGNEVANPSAQHEIVMLVESVSDVRCLDKTLERLACDAVYQKHLEAIGRMTVMIAHSDNRRRDGYSAGEVITRMEGTIAALQRDLWELAVAEDIAPLLNISDRFGVPIYIFDGGGNDLMRGAAVNPGQSGKQHGHAAARENAPTIRTPQNTIQGEQTRLLFGYPQCAAMFLEMMVSQTMYAKAAVEKQIGIVPALDDKDLSREQRRLAGTLLDPAYQRAQREAQRSAFMFHDKARKMFHLYTDQRRGKINPFDELFSHSGAWISTLLANRGSRSNQRGKSDSDVNRTVAQIRGNRTALSQRAITGNLLFQLSGTFHLGLLGQLEAFAHIGEAAAYQMFHSSLPDRTHIVGIAQQLHMTDFAKAWRMMGEDQPDTLKMERLAGRFSQRWRNGEVPTPRETLAFMEDYGLRLAKAIFQVATGRQADEAFANAGRRFEIQDAYRTLLPELARQLDMRHASHEAEHLALARLERLFSDYPEQTISEPMEMMAVALVGALSYDVRPALGPMAVRGAKGVATTHEESAVSRGERLQPDIRDELADMGAYRGSSGMRAPFTNTEALARLRLPPGLETR